MKKKLLALLLVAALLTFTSTVVFAGDDIDPDHSITPIVIEP